MLIRAQTRKSFSPVVIRKPEQRNRVAARNSCISSCRNFARVMYCSTTSPPLTNILHQPKPTHQVVKLKSRTHHGPWQVLSLDDNTLVTLMQRRKKALDFQLSQALVCARNEIAKFYFNDGDVLTALEWAEPLIDEECAGTELWNANMLASAIQEASPAAVNHAFRLMFALQIPPNVRTINILLLKYTQLPPSKFVLEVLKYIARLKIRPNDTTAALLQYIEDSVDQYLSSDEDNQVAQDIQSAINATLVSAQRYLNPAVSYDELLLKEFSKAGYVGSVEDVISKMRSDGIVTKTTFILNYLIQAYGNAKNFPSAMETFQKLKENPDTPPDVDTLNSILTACVRCNKLYEARTIWRELTMSRDALVTPNSKSYALLFQLLGREAELQLAFEEMESLIKTNPRKITYGLCRKFVIANIIHNDIVEFSDLSVLGFVGKSPKLNHVQLSKEDLSQFVESMEVWKEVYKAMDPKPKPKPRRVTPLKDEEEDIEAPTTGSS